MLEKPAVGDLILPADVPGVLPEEAHLLRCVSGVPQGVAHVLPRTSLRLHSLDLEGKTVGLRDDQR